MEIEPSGQTFSGSLLVAHPGLLDPNFRRTVILLSAHSTDDGALGVVLNRPLGESLGEKEEDFAFGPLADVPLFQGGPVGADQMILAAFRWNAGENAFQLYFGLGPDQAKAMKEDEPGLDLRGFLGYSGWSGGQLETELEEHAWVLSPVRPEALELPDGEGFWTTLLRNVKPELTFLADEPDDPSLN